jgi:hypothetical protein
MANLWCDGFGRYGGDEAKMLNGSSGQAWAEMTGGASGWLLSNSNPRTGTWHLRTLDGTAQPIARRVFGAPKDEVFFGQALYFDELPTLEIADGSGNAGFWLAAFRNQSNGMEIGVSLGTDGAVCVWRGEFVLANWDNGNFSGTLLHRSLPCVGAGAYQHFEHYLKIDGTVGAYELRVDEVTRINITGINTDRTGGGEVSQVVVGRSGGLAFGGSGFVDLADVYANDTETDASGCDTWIGDCKSGCLMVNADTAQADFTLSTGVSGYALLDDIPPNDSDYIETTSSTAESNFGLEDGPASLSEILTVRPFVRAMKDDAGTCTIAPNMKSDGTKGTVDSQPITTAFAYYDSNVPVDPDTGVPWTASGLNAAEHVVERTA